MVSHRNLHTHTQRERERERERQTNHYNNLTRDEHTAEQTHTHTHTHTERQRTLHYSAEELVPFRPHLSRPSRYLLSLSSLPPPPLPSIQSLSLSLCSLRDRRTCTTTHLVHTRIMSSKYGGLRHRTRQLFNRLYQVLYEGISPLLLPAASLLLCVAIHKKMKFMIHHTRQTQNTHTHKICVLMMERERERGKFEHRRNFHDIQTNRDVNRKYT